MKNILFTLSLLFISIISFSQKQDLNKLKQSTLKSINTQFSPTKHNVIWTDDFSNATNWVIHNDEGNTQNWKITSYKPMGYYSGWMGKINSETPSKIALMDAELLSNGESLQRAKLTVANPINCADYSSVNIKFYSYFGKIGSKIYFRISSNNGETWTDYEMHPELADWYVTANPEIIYLDITEQAAGKEEVLIQFYYDGLEENTGIAWMIDDITIYEPNGVDANILSLDNYWLMNLSDTLIVSSQMQNLGNETITDITLSYTINDFTSSSATINGLNIKPFDFFNVNHPEPYLFIEEGNYTPSLSITHINGNSVEIEATGDFIEVFDNTNSNAILGELFTSSTCAPCAGFNPFYDAVQDLVSPSLLNTVKYQMNWPGAGDPYFTSDGGIRREYYEINSVPSLYVNGTFVDINSYGLDFVRSALKQTSTLDIEIEGKISENIVNTEIKIIATEDLNNADLFVSVNEKQTHNNIGSNGESEFNNVMLKMLPDAYGEHIELLKSNDSTMFQFNYDMSTTYMEEYNDLEIVAFIQNKDTKEILQSASLDLSWKESITSVNQPIKNNFDVTIYPNPTTNQIQVDTDYNFDISIFSMLGGLIVYSENCQPHERIDLSKLPKGVYLATFNKLNNVVTKKIIIE